ncbi:MAG: ATP-binding protein [Prolixibacteraceae bacterium]
MNDTEEQTQESTEISSRFLSERIKELENYQQELIRINEELIAENERLKGIDQQIDGGENASSNMNDEIFRQFLEHSPFYVFFKDDHIRSLILSRNFEAMLSKKMDEIIGKTMDELFPSDIAKKMVEDDLHILRSGKKIQIEEEFNGRSYETIKFPIQIGGKPRFLAGFTIDTTERKKAEEALKRSEARLIELNATKDKFFSIISHDLRSPFTSILGLSYILIEQIEKKDYEGLEKYASIMQGASKRAMDLLMNLMEWSRSQSGRIEFFPEYFRINSLLDEVEELFYSASVQKSITITKNLPANFLVHADKAMIGSVLRNLISNAIKFTNSGGEIVISTEQHQKELVVTIADNGIGIPADVLPKLFRIEESASTSGTNNEQGTGLGLILCKGFIEKHGGSIWVESNSKFASNENGSTFKFTLPMI